MRRLKDLGANFRAKCCMCSREEESLIEERSQTAEQYSIIGQKLVLKRVEGEEISQK